MTLTPVQHRYTSDSWSLELTGTPSPLSRWTGRTVMKNQQFRLSLLNFELGAAPILWLEGDRKLLETLHHTTEQYVQNQLQQPTLQFAGGGNGLATELVPSPNPLAPSDSRFSLGPSGALSHHLRYSPRNAVAKALELSTIQLADLVEVLDRWQAETLSLPKEGLTALAGGKTSDFAMPAWGRVAASVAIALGATGTGLYFIYNPLNSAPTAEVALDPNATGDISAFPEISTNPSGQLPDGQFGQPFLKQQDPNNPNGTVPLGPDGQPVNQPPSGIFNGPAPANSSVAPPDGANGTTGDSLSGSNGVTTVPLPEGSVGVQSYPVTPVVPVAPPPNISLQTNPNTSGTTSSGGTSASSTQSSSSVPARTESPFKTAQEQLAAAEAELEARQSTTAKQPAESAEIPQKEPVASANSPANGAAANGAAMADGAPPASAAAKPTAPPKPVNSSTANTAPPPAAPAAVAAVSALPPNNQAKAVQSYFESRWQPPSNLAQPLQYQLIVGANGTLTKSAPLSSAAGLYADKAGIPAIGEPFISAGSNAQTSTLLLTLRPDGKVEVAVQKVSGGN